MRGHTYAFSLKFGRLTASSKIMEPVTVLFHFRAYSRIADKCQFK